MPYYYKLSYLTREKDILPKAIGKIVVAKEEGEIFFREKLNGSLEVTGDDYAFLLDAQKFAVECCQEITLYIERKCGSGRELIWEGFFVLQDIEWDYDNTQATIKKIAVRDDYNAIFTNWQKEISWLGFEGSARPVRNGGSQYSSTRPLKPFRQFSPPYPDYNPTKSDRYVRGMDFVESLHFLIKKTLAGTPGEKAGNFVQSSLSKFFTETTNPVTGKPNALKNIVLMHLSDAKRPYASNPATVGNVTLKDVLDELKKMFNAYWFVNIDGKLQIEHITYFPNQAYTAPTVKLDLTLDKYKDVMKGNNRMSYQTEKLKGIEGLDWSISSGAFDAQSELWTLDANPSLIEFSGAYMRYADSCVPKDDKGEKTTEYKTVSLFTTDWLSVSRKPDTVPDEGWMLVHVKDFTRNDAVEYGWLPIINATAMNGALSATRLFYDFMRYDLSFSYGIFSAEKEKSKPVTGTLPYEIPAKAKTVKRIKTFTTVNLGLCCGNEYDFSGYIKHPLSDRCVVDQIEYDLVSESIEITVTAASLCSDIPFPDYDEEISEPEPECFAYGTPLRTVQTNKTYTNVNWADLITITYTDYYADGKCGEYSSTHETKEYVQKRNNGTR